MNVELALSRRETLPDEFTFELSDLVMMQCKNPQAFEVSWREIRSALVKRGYEVIEWRDNDSMAHKVKCVRAPAYAAPSEVFEV